MISLVRVDDRLIHGQVTVGWVPYLHASRIVVISDRLAEVPVLASILKTGGPANVHVDVLGVEEAIELLHRGDGNDSRVLVLFESLEGVRLALQKGLELDVLNIGGLRGRGSGIRVSDAVFLTHADQDILAELSLKGVRLELRIMPTDRPRYLSREEGGQWRT